MAAWVRMDLSLSIFVEPVGVRVAGGGGAGSVAAAGGAGDGWRARLYSSRRPSRAPSSR